MPDALGFVENRVEGKESHGAEASSKKRKKAYIEDAANSSAAVRKPRKRSKKGCLARFLEIPVDILYEIARNLSPGDVLNLSRSTRSWRDLLMSRNSKPIWRAARDNVGVPDCPDDISEPKYADLLYGRGCMLCDSGMARKLYFALRLRLCKSCSASHVCWGCELLCKRSPDLYRNREAAEEVFALAPHCPRPQCLWIVCSREGAAWFLRDELGEVIEKYITLRSDEKEEYVRTRKACTTRVNEHAKLVRIWFRDQEEKKTHVKAAISAKRFEEIYKRLRDLGYADSDLRHSTARWIKLTVEPKNLTERAWNRIKPELESIIKEKIEQREQREREKREEMDAFCRRCKALRALRLKSRALDRN